MRLQLADHVRQAMQRLRAEHQVDERARAAVMRLAFLARDAAAHADEHVRLGFLSARHSPSSENTFSCAFSRTEQVFMSSTSASAGSSVG